DRLMSVGPSRPATGRRCVARSPAFSLLSEQGTWMPRAFLIIGLLGWLALGRVPRSPAAPAEPPVALQLNDVPLRAALGLLFQGRTARHLVDPRVPASRVSVHIEKAPLSTAVRVLLRAAGEGDAGLTFSRSEDLYLIRRRESPGWRAAGPRLPEC